VGFVQVETEKQPFGSKHCVHGKKKNYFKYILSAHVAMGILT